MPAWKDPAGAHEETKTSYPAAIGYSAKDRLQSCAWHRTKALLGQTSSCVAPVTLCPLHGRISAFPSSVDPALVFSHFNVAEFKAAAPLQHRLRLAPACLSVVALTNVPLIETSLQRVLISRRVLEVWVTANKIVLFSVLGVLQQHLF